MDFKEEDGRVLREHNKDPLVSCSNYLTSAPTAAGLPARWSLTAAPQTQASPDQALTPLQGLYSALSAKLERKISPSISSLQGNVLSRFTICALKVLYN